MCSLVCLTMKVVAALRPKSCRQVRADAHGQSETTDMMEVIAVNRVSGSDALAATESRCTPVKSNCCTGIRVDFF